MHLRVPYSEIVMEKAKKCINLYQTMTYPRQVVLHAEKTSFLLSPGDMSPIRYFYSSISIE